MLVVALLGGCLQAPAPVAYRDPAAVISSTTAFDPARFQGDWQVVGAFGAGAACGVLAESWVIENGAFTVRGTDCAGGRTRGFATRARLVGPGRLLRATRGGEEALWVLWVDGDYRIAAIGTPSGAFGRIMARPGVARADLTEAARQVLDFNGYDLSQLRMMR